MKLKRINKSKLVLLQSGGLDSNVLASLYCKDFDVHHVFVDYGQNQKEQELKMAKRIVDYYGGTLHEVTLYLPWLSSSTTLVGGEVTDWDSKGTLNCNESLTYVPIRNHMFVSLACSLAESLEAKYIAMGFDGSEDEDRKPTGGTTDKHPNFVRMLEDSLNEGSSFYHILKKRFTLLTPIMDMYKYQIIELGVENKADFSISWSCYNSGEVPCLKCSACRCRTEAFEYLGLKDPLMK